MTGNKNRKALVVDDNPRWLGTLSNLARYLGYDVVTAISLNQAQEQATEYQGPLDLVITDIRLEDNDASNIDGIKLLQNLRSSGQLRASIVVTGYPSEATRQLAEQIGSTYLVKGRFAKKDFADAEREARQQGELRNLGIDTIEKSTSLLQQLLQFLRGNGPEKDDHRFCSENRDLERHILAFHHMSEQFQNTGGY